MGRIVSSAAEPIPNVAFSVFYSEVLAIFNTMNADRKRRFRITVGNYFKQTDPDREWSEIIDRLTRGSALRISWPGSYLEEIRQGRAQIKRTIAFYYYLHSLSHDLSFATAVDEIVFVDEPVGERSFAKAHGGKPVFQTPDPSPAAEDLSWKSALNRWEFERVKNVAANGLFASLSIERTQGGDTREPLALLAEVHIRPAYEHESGIELHFRSADIALGGTEGTPSEVAYFELREGEASNAAHRFWLQGTGSSPYITLSDDAGLDGTYVSDTLGAFHPNCSSAELSAALLVRVLTANAIFPEDVPTVMKRRIIQRIVEKATLPAPDRYGHILLHELRYRVRSVAR